jgi:uncharacterized protein (TIGR00290 family)
MSSVISWSSGKDAAFSLSGLLGGPGAPSLLFTTVNRTYGRVSMHGVRIELLRAQSRAIGFPLYEVPLNETVDLAAYNRIMHQHLTSLAAQGFDTMYFGDIFLEDLKELRIRQLAQAGLKAAFPVWGYDTSRMAMEIIRSGIKAVVVAANARVLDESFVGRPYDENFLADLPPGVDACGENGEFHTFVYDAPFFKTPLPVVTGRKVLRSFKKCDQSDDDTLDRTAWDTDFWYSDLLLRQD